MSAIAVDTIQLIQTRISERLGPQRYKVWIKNGTRLQLSDGYLKIGVPNIFTGEWIERHYADEIASAAAEVVGKPLNVGYEVDPTLAANLRKRQLDSQAEYVAKNPERMARQQLRNGEPARTSPLKGRLDDFVVGESNQVAYSAACSVVDQPSAQCNPLFVHGGCGLGKTHLLQGIFNGLRERHPDLGVLLVSGEDFANQFVFAMKTQKLDAFRARFRDVDVLLVDDIHFMANKRGIQEEFLHTFNTIDTQGRQIVMASDAHPRLIGHFSESLLTRFIAGMVVRIDRPSRDMRIQILQRASRRLPRPFPQAVIDFIADNLVTNVRELEGAMLTVHAYATVSHQPVTVSLAERALQNHITKTPPLLRASEIENVVATYFGVTPADLHSSRKTRLIADARGVAMHLIYEHTPLSTPEIGRFLGNKDHSTVVLARKRIRRALGESKSVVRRTQEGIQALPLEAVLTELEAQLGRRPG